MEKTCLSLPKESQLNKESNEIVETGSKEDKEYHRDIINENVVTDRVNAIDNDSSRPEEVFQAFKKIVFRRDKCFQEAVTNIIHSGQC